MATVTVKPNGDGSNPGSWTHTNSNFYTEVDEGIASADDATTAISQSSSTGNLFLLLGDMPANFSAATAVEFQVRHQRSTTKGDAKSYSIALYQSDETTAITGISNPAPPVGYSTQTGLSPSITGGTSKTIWDGARVRVQGNGTAGTLDISTIDVIVTYTATGGTTYNETGSGGAVGGSSSTGSKVTSVTLTGGSLANSSANFYLSANITLTGGSVAGGQGSVSLLPGGSPSITVFNYSNDDGSGDWRFNWRWKWSWGWSWKWRWK